MLLNDRVGQAIALAARHNSRVAVLFLDLDGFKHINDSLGHPIGDKLLQSVAKRLVDGVRDSDTVSRQGGDEFVVLLSDLAQPEDAIISVNRMLMMLAAPHFIGQHDLCMTASIGVSIYPDDGLECGDAYQECGHRDVSGQGKWASKLSIFQAGHERPSRGAPIHRGKPAARPGTPGIRTALPAEGPIRGRGAITGAEALIRWTHPTRGPVSPGQFIPIAEECGSDSADQQVGAARSVSASP